MLAGKALLPFCVDRSIPRFFHAVVCNVKLFGTFQANKFIGFVWILPPKFHPTPEGSIFSNMSLESSAIVTLAATPSIVREKHLYYACVVWQVDIFGY